MKVQVIGIPKIENQSVHAIEMPEHINKPDAYYLVIEVPDSWKEHTIAVMFARAAKDPQMHPRCQELAQYILNVMNNY